MQVDFCLPVRNEEKILATNVARLKSFLESQSWPITWKIIIIINGSNDASVKIAKELEDERVKFKAIEAAGKGLALKTGFQESSADVLVFMDVDLAVSLENIIDLIQPLLDNQSDLVIGSRLLSESKTVRSGFREFSSQAYNFLSRLILGHSLSDLQCGFKAIKHSVFNKANQFLCDDQWFFDTELVVITKYLGYRVKEIPVDWQENRYDERQSKVKVFKDCWVFIKNLFILKNRLKKIKK